MDKKADLATLGVRAGQVRTGFNEHAEALFLTSSFVFDNAEQAAARFTGTEGGFVYSRFTNPTVAMFQDRLAALEGAEACMATASGMSAILATVMSLLKSGDHIVCSSAVFGATVQLLGTYFARLGIQTTFVSPTRVDDWRAAVRPTTRLFFLETPPQHALAKRQQKAGGAVLSFELKGGKDAAFRLINGTRLVSITANLGDVKSTITHPATTTHGRISPEARAAAGITDGLVRLAVGLEAVSDLQADLERGLS